MPEEKGESVRAVKSKAVDEGRAHCLAKTRGRRDHYSRHLKRGIYGSIKTLASLCISSSCCGVDLPRRVSIRLRRSRSSSSLSRDKSIRGERPSPFAIATIVSRLGTFLPRSTSPQKLAVMSPRSAALSRLSLAFFLSLRTRLANWERCFKAVRSHTITSMRASSHSR